jgi:phosphate transport system substrate-binding protein
MKLSSCLRWLLPPVLAAGAVVAPIAAGGAGAAPTRTELASATLNGSGSTFQQAFDEAVIGAFKQKEPAVTINYSGGGSGKGRQDFTDGVVQWAGTDGLYKDTDPQPPAGEWYYFPTVAGPITVSYNLDGVKGLKLDADTIAKIFQAEITTWDDPAIAALNPKADLPSEAITVAHRADSSGTTENFTKYLAAAAPTVWTLGSGSTVSWPSNTQAGQGNSGVAQIVQSTDGAIGYVDFSDAKAAGLSFASVKNKAGKYVKPSIKSTEAAVDGATIEKNLTYSPLDSPGKKAYPIASPTWILANKSYSDAAVAKAMKGFLNFIYGDGQEIAPSVDYAPLPEQLLKDAKAQVKQITAGG